MRLTNVDKWINEIEKKNRISGSNWTEKWVNEKNKREKNIACLVELT